MDLETRLRELLDEGEALLRVWIDEEGDLLFEINEEQPHFQVDGNEVTTIEYHPIQ